MADTNTLQSDKSNKRKPISCLELNYTDLPGRTHAYFVVSVFRGDWMKDDAHVHNYCRPSRASLLRVNRAQRLLIRRVDAAGYVADLPAVVIEPETATELSQLVTTEYEAAQPVRMCRTADCLNAADPTTPGGAYCIACDVTGRALPRWTGEQIIAREG